MNGKNGSIRPTARKTKEKSGLRDELIGRRVVMARASLGLTQADIARSLGVSSQQMQKYERGVTQLSASRLAKLSDMLRQPVEYFYQDFASARVLGRAWRSGGGRARSTACRRGDARLNREAREIEKNFRRIGSRGLRHAIVDIVRRLAMSSPERSTRA